MRQALFSSSLRVLMDLEMSIFSLFREGNVPQHSYWIERS